jgi:predicted phosphodiesterase
MKILFSSDIHGLIPAYKQFSELLKNSDFDLGILSGDLMTHFSLEESEENLL